MKLLVSIGNKIAKDKNGETVPHLEIIEVVLFHCNIVNNDYQQGSYFLACICSKQTIWYFIKKFTNKFYLFKIIQFKISRNSSMAYRPKWSNIRNRR